MVAVRRIGCLLLALGLLAGAPARTRGAEEYRPREGQPGKDVVWLPSALTMVNAMLDLAQLTPRDHLVDLGSGDGRLVITAAKRGARAQGIEYNPELVALSQRHARAEGVSSRATFVAADIFESDFSQASVVTMFLLPDLNLRLRPQLLALRAGTRVVSNTFGMDDWDPDETVTVREHCETYCTALLWVVPAKVDGEWALPQGRLELTQRFQAVAGTLDLGQRRLAISGGALRGDEIRFRVGGADYVGRVSGDTMQGQVRSRGSDGSWKATRVR